VKKIVSFASLRGSLQAGEQLTGLNINQDIDPTPMPGLVCTVYKI
jgi:hypothetical protein